MIPAALLLTVQPPADAVWREYDRRQSGWAESPAEYDSAHVKRRGDRVLVWTRHVVRLSGLPDPHIAERVDIDCRNRGSRTLAILREQGRLRRFARLTTGAYRAIDPDGSDARLAQLLCRPVADSETAGPGLAQAGE